jgi:hypothetical protein
VWRVDVTPDQRAVASGFAYGDVPAGAVQRFPAEGRPAEVVAAAMDAVNPVYVPRNHLVEAALEEGAEDGRIDGAPVHVGGGAVQGCSAQGPPRGRQPQESMAQPRERRTGRQSTAWHFPPV